MELTPLGDSALLIRVCAQGEALTSECASAVLRTLEALRAARIPAITELVPAYATIAAFYDGRGPGEVASRVSLRIQEALAVAGPQAGTAVGRLVEIPVCYDRDFALDLEAVAERAGWPAAEVIERHTAAPYVVRCIGFTPGFPYLSGLPPDLATPRRERPRKIVPAGSVAIGGAQAGIYPFASPGGWNIIGRTPLRLFAPDREPPSLLRAGDSVRFVRIERKAFDAQAS